MPTKKAKCKPCDGATEGFAAIGLIATVIVAIGLLIGTASVLWDVSKIDGLEARVEKLERTVRQQQIEIEVWKR